MRSLIVILLVILTAAGCISAAVGSNVTKNSKQTVKVHTHVHSVSVAEIENTELEVEREKCLQASIVLEFVVTNAKKSVRTNLYNSNVNGALHEVYFVLLHTLLI